MNILLAILLAWPIVWGGGTTNHIASPRADATQHTQTVSPDSGHGRPCNPNAAGCQYPCNPNAGGCKWEPLATPKPFTLEWFESFLK